MTQTIDKMAERIMVVDRAVLFENERLTFQGVKTDYNFILLMQQKFKEFFTVRRGPAEINPDWKQLITYGIVKRGKDIFMYERLTEGGETRLHNQLSIGVGGHMNEEVDVFEEIPSYAVNDLIKYNFLREITEELDIMVPMSYQPDLKIVGIINDETNEVGTVHLGLVAVVELPEASDVKVRETDQLKGSWVSIEDLKEDHVFGRLENWSKIAAEIL